MRNSQVTSLTRADLESKSLGRVFVFGGCGMAAGETSSFCVKDRETEVELEEQQ